VSTDTAPGEAGGTSDCAEPVAAGALGNGAITVGGIDGVAGATGKNEPPVISVATMPAMTATRARPIAMSGQFRRNQSMFPNLPRGRSCPAWRIPQRGALQAAW
jgi:hypothetical protein